MQVAERFREDDQHDLQHRKRRREETAAAAGAMNTPVDLTGDSQPTGMDEDGEDAVIELTDSPDEAAAVAAAEAQPRAPKRDRRAAQG